MTSNTNILDQRTSPKAGSVRSVSGFTRPPDTTAYTAGDVIFDTTAAGVIQFDGVSAAGMIMAASCFMGEVDPVDLELYLFDVEPTNLGDNTPFTISSGDLGDFIGVYSFADADKKTVNTTIRLYEAATHAPLAYTSSGGSLFGILVTRSAFTPAANTPFALALHIESDQ